MQTAPASAAATAMISASADIKAVSRARNGDTAIDARVAALAERVTRAAPLEGEEANFLRALHVALAADPRTFRAAHLPTADVTQSELETWQPLVASGAFAPGSATDAFAAAAAKGAANAHTRKRKGAASAAAAVSVPFLVRVLHALWQYSATLEAVKFSNCALGANAVALVCAALSGVDRMTSRAHANGASGGGLRSLTIAHNDVYSTAPPAEHSSAWYLAQYLRANASLRRLDVSDRFPVSATDMAELCDALVVRRDAFGATLDCLDVSNNAIFEVPPDATAEQCDAYTDVVDRIAAFGPRNAATERVCTRAVDERVDGYEYPRRCHFPAAVQRLHIDHCGHPLDAALILRGAVRGVQPHGDGDGADRDAVPPDSALTGLRANYAEWPVECVSDVDGWLRDAACTLRTFAGSWAADTGVAPLPLQWTMPHCALFANTSLTALAVANADQLTNTEFVALLTAVRTHPALRRLRLDDNGHAQGVTTRACGDDDTPRAVRAALATWPVPCVALLTRFDGLDTDDLALPPCARAQAVAELMAFGADHFEELWVAHHLRLLNDLPLPLAQHWLYDAARHCDIASPMRRRVEREGERLVPVPVPVSVSAADTTGTAATIATTSAALLAPVHSRASEEATEISARLAAAPKVARFSSLKRLTLEYGAAAFQALRTALAPPNGVLSRSLEELDLTAALGTTRRVGNPWLAYDGDKREVEAAFAATGSAPLAASAASFLREGLRHNTALTKLALADLELTDAVVSDGLLPLLLTPRSARADVRVDCATNRTLRQFHVNGSFTAQCVPSIAQIIAAAPAHGLRELRVCTNNELPVDAFDPIARALTALQAVGTAHVVVDLRTDEHDQHPLHDGIHELSREGQRRAARARRQWARIAVAAVSYRRSRGRRLGSGQQRTASADSHHSARGAVTACACIGRRGQSTDC